MVNEAKILFENIKNFRLLLTEGVSQDSIVDAINNHEWLYIYYNADNEEGKNATGYRTIRPMVLGTNKGGNTVLRAWQDNPRNSWHFANKATRDDSLHHDYWTDQEGSKPGWRLFNVDKISKVYPIGKKFNDSNGLPMIPAGYHEGGDDNMTSIIAYVSTKKEPDFDMKYDKGTEVDKVSRAERDRAKWDGIRRGNKNRKQITVDDINKLNNIATNVMKTSRGSYLVVIDDKDNFQIILAKDKDKQAIPDTAIVGSLQYLYDTMVKGNAPTDTGFFDSVKSKAQTDLNQKQQTDVNQQEPDLKETDSPTIPYKKMNFFK